MKVYAPDYYSGFRCMANANLEAGLNYFDTACKGDGRSMGGCPFPGIFLIRYSEPDQTQHNL